MIVLALLKQTKEGHAMTPTGTHAASARRARGQANADLLKTS